MNIPRPNDENSYELTEDDWYNINLAIKMIMDAYGVHVNYNNGCLMRDELKGNFNSINYRDERYWWLDKFKTSYNPESGQEETV